MINGDYLVSIDLAYFHRILTTYLTKKQKDYL